jgi:hypothetical protein
VCGIRLCVILSHVSLKSAEGRDRVKKRLHMEGRSLNDVADILEVGDTTKHT